VNVSPLASGTPHAPAAEPCPPGSRAGEQVFPGAGDRIVTCRDSAGGSRAVLETPPGPQDAPPLQRSLATIGLGMIAAPALGAIAEEGGLAAAASFGAKALEGLRDSVTKPAEIGKLVGGGIAFEVLKGLYERVASAVAGAPGDAHGASHEGSHAARSPSP